MKICDLSIEQIKVGLRIVGLKSRKYGTVVRIDAEDSNHCWIQFDNEPNWCSGWYGTASKCEILMNLDGSPQIMELPGKVYSPKLSKNEFAKMASDDAWTTPSAEIRTRSRSYDLESVEPESAGNAGHQTIQPLTIQRERPSTYPAGYGDQSPNAPMNPIRTIVNSFSSTNRGRR